MGTANLTREEFRQRGDVIRALRIASGRRVGDLASACGLKAGSLTNIESGVQQASWRALHALARELRTPINTLLRDPDTPQPVRANGTAA